jgi:hypothetical protein
MNIDTELDRVIVKAEAFLAKESDVFRKLRALKALKSSAAIAEPAPIKRKAKAKHRKAPKPAVVAAPIEPTKPPTICDMIRRVVRESAGKVTAIDVTDAVEKMSGQARFDRKNCSSQITQLVKKGEFVKDANYMLAPAKRA